MPTFVVQPTEPGHMLPYCVARLDPITREYIPLTGQEFATEEEAAALAAELNAEDHNLN